MCRVSLGEPGRSAAPMRKGHDDDVEDEQQPN